MGLRGQWRSYSVVGGLILATVRLGSGEGFAKAVADILARTFPDRFTTAMAKEKRAGKIFVDYLRNVAGATVVAAYSPRAKPNAPVSVPIAWKELHEGDLRLDHFNIRNVPQRLKRLKLDPWADYNRVRQGITGEMMRIVGYSG